MWRLSLTKQARYTIIVIKEGDRMEEKEVLKSNLSAWEDILKDDHQWDFTFLEKVILHKVKLMRSYYQSGQSNIVQESVDRTIEEMTIVIEAFERLLENDYIDIPEGKEPKVEFNPIEGEKVSSIRFNYHDDYGPEELEKIYQKAEDKMLKDRALAYDTLRDKSPNWWD